MEGTMNCEESKNLITISVYGKLTPSERDLLKAHLRECSRCTDIYNKAEKLSHLFNEKEDIPLPDKEKSWQIISAKALHGRGSWLERFLLKKPALRLSYALLLLAVGFAGGYFIHSHWQQGTEIALLHQEVIQIREITAASLLRQESLNEKLRDLSTGSLLTQADEESIRAFLRTMKGDTGIHLRPASVNDPYTYLIDPEARAEFIQSISEQTSPLVEIALALTHHIEQFKLH
jgi:hypothetical protein